MSVFLDLFWCLFWFVFKVHLVRSLPAFMYREPSAFCYFSSWLAPEWILFCEKLFAKYPIVCPPEKNRWLSGRGWNRKIITKQLLIHPHGMKVWWVIHDISQFTPVWKEKYCENDRKLCFHVLFNMIHLPYEERTISRCVPVLVLSENIPWLCMGFINEISIITLSKSRASYHYKCHAVHCAVLNVQVIL